MAESAADIRLANHSTAWEMLPGETLNGLAALFYKGDRPMQRRFVAAALRLNRGLQPIADGNTVFTNATQIIIPDLKYLSASAPRKHSVSAPATAVSAPAPVLAANMLDSTGVAPDLVAQYETLVKLNAGLKTELERLNDRLRQLQAVMEELLKRLQAMISQERTAQLATASNHAGATQTHGLQHQNDQIEGGENVSSLTAQQTAIKPLELANSPGDKQAQADPAQVAPTQVTRTHVTRTQVKPVEVKPVEVKPDSASRGEDGKNEASVAVERKDAPAAPSAEPAPRQFKQVDAGTPTPARKAVTAKQVPADGTDLVKILIPILLTLVAVGSFVLIYRWRVHPLSRPTILQQPSIQPPFRPTTQRGRMQQEYPDVGLQEFRTANQPATLPPAQPLLPVQPTRELLANARLLMAENNPEAALALLQAYVDAYPEQSILPWLHALEIHHNMHHRKSFSQLADRMHDTFSEEIAAWSDAETGVSIESNAAEYRHIQEELEQIWLTDRAAFSTEVLKEIVVLQEVLKTRNQPVHPEKIPQLS